MTRVTETLPMDSSHQLGGEESDKYTIDPAESAVFSPQAKVCGALALNAENCYMPAAA